MRIVCINCLTEFQEADVQWRDDSGAPHAPSTQRSFLRKVFDKLEGRTSAVDAVDVLGRLAKGLVPFCPNGCRVPSEMLDRPSRVIGLVGLPGSSKTTVLTSMIYCTARDAKLAKMIDVALSPVSNRAWIEVRDAQFKRKLPVEGNQARAGRGDALDQSSNPHHWSHLIEREPLVVEVRPRGGGRGVNYVFIDVSGEDIVNANEAARVSPHLAIADSLWFFVTPNICDELVEQIEHNAAAEVVANLRENYGEHSQDIESTTIMIRQIAMLWKRARHMDPDKVPGRPRISATVLVTKADLLSNIAPTHPMADTVARVAPPRDWLDDPATPSDLYDPFEIDERSEQTSKLIDGLLPQVHNSVTSNFHEPRFLPVAAIGDVSRAVDPDDPTERRYAGVKPFGVIDLFITLLQDTPQLGLFR